MTGAVLVRNTKLDPLPGRLFCMETHRGLTDKQHKANCYDHALLVTGYDVLLSTLQGDLSFSTSSASSFASTHAGPDHFHLIDLRLRHHALSDSCLEPPSRVLPHGQ